MSVKLNCVITDDEPLARKGLENFAKEIPFLNPLASCSNPLELMDVLTQQKVDLLFLDIQMPKMSGLEFLRTLKQAPLTIITTAYPNYAPEGFELDVIDYIIKPISFERFTKAANKALEFYLLRHNEGNLRPAKEDFFFIKCEHRYEKVFYDEVLFVEGMQNYVVIQTQNRRLVSHITFKSAEEYLPSDRFIKVQKSYIVSIAKIDKIEGNEIRIGSHTITISRNLKEEIMSLILKDRFMKR